jgi:hypothetical protein
LVFALGTAGTASADTTLGSTSEPAGVTRAPCQPNIVVAQFTDNPSHPFFVPGPGTITQWQINTAGSASGQPVTLVVLRPAAGGSFTVVGADSRTLPSPLPSGGVATFQLTTPIAVTANDTFGLWSSAPAARCYWTGGAIPAASTLVALTEASPPATNQTLPQRSFSPVSPAGFTMDLAANFVPAPTGQRAAALKKCKKKHKKKARKKCRNKAKLLPV